MNEVPHYQIRTAQEYDEQSSERLAARQLASRALYTLMLQGEGSGAPAALQAPVYIRSLQRHPDGLRIKLSYTDDDGRPGDKVHDGILLDHVWYPDMVAQLKLPGYDEVTSVRTGYFRLGEGIDDIDQIARNYSRVVEKFYLEKEERYNLR